MDKFGSGTTYSIKVTLCSGRVLEVVGTVNDAMELFDTYKSSVIEVEMKKTEEKVNGKPD